MSIRIQTGLWASATAFSLVFSASWAHAEEPAQAPPAVPAAPSVQAPSSPLHTGSRWYGWQTLSTDAASLMLVIASGSSGDAASATLGSTALGTYLLGGPIVHFAHGHVGKGIGSLLLRGGLPIVSGVVGYQAASSDCGGGEFCGLGGVLLGGLAGMVGAVVIDATVLGYEPVPVPQRNWPSVGVASDGRRTLLTAQGRF